MDDFALRMLEKAEKRSKELGLSAPSPRLPLTDSNSDNGNNDAAVKKSTVDTYNSSPRSTTKVTRQFSTSDKGSKENDVEINITAPSNVQVDVEISECEVDEHGNEIYKDASSETSSEAKAIAPRDTPRGHLQRLGALYADKDISSPIHRNEDKFHEGLSENSSRPRTKFTRLAALASEINSWEDDPSHPDYKHHRKTINANGSPRKDSYGKKKAAPMPPNVATSSPKKPLVSPVKPVVSPRRVIPDISSKNAEQQREDARTKYGAGTKNLEWDSKVMSNLEQQGFKRRDTTHQRLVYEFNDEKKEQKNEKDDVDAKKSVASRYIEQREMPKAAEKKAAPSTSKGIVSGRAAMFDKPKRKSIMGKDPTELSLKERMAIFEKNKEFIPVPKAPITLAAPVKATKSMPIKPTTVQTRVEINKKIDEEEEIAPTPVQKSTSTVDGSSSREMKGLGLGVLSTVANLMSKGPTISEAKISQEIRKQREEEMDLLLNRHKYKEPTSERRSVPRAPPLPPAGYLSSPGSSLNKRRSGDDAISPEVKSTLEDVKRIRVAPPKEGHLYPALSDIESANTESDNEQYATASASDEGEHLFQVGEHRLSAQQIIRRQSMTVTYDDDSYMDSTDADDDNICNSSLGREVMHTVTNRRSNNRRSSHNKNQSLQSSASEISDVLGDMDQYLEEALDESDDESEDYSTPKKGSISSNSFCYDKNPKKQVHYQTIDEESDASSNVESYKSPVKSELTVNPSDDNNMVTLVHTVSFYRKQQTQNATPVRKITKPISAIDAAEKKMEYDYSDDDDESCYGRANDNQVQEKIKKLLDEVCKQQTIISQTSQALNLCAATIEFSGSTESVEGERHLLVATHRRQACLDEVQRLRVEGCLRPENAPTEKGRLTIRDITVPLKQDYIRKLATDAISGHHLVCLLKYNETVLATKTVPTLPGLLGVKFPDVLTLNNVYADFKITMEIYGMTAQREVLPHEVKYHISVGKKGSSKMLTPKNKKDNRLVMPPVQSPAGPNAVRTPALIQYGFIIFSLKEIQRTTWSLNSVGGVSPLEGSVHMRVNCELSVNIDYRGFLTMYEDVSGFGAWHRRWCRLKGNVINFWLYPDDEKKKAPMGSIDLQSCSTQKVTTAPRDMCARMNTLMLEFKRPTQEGDYESLTMELMKDSRGNRVTVTRRFLSADTKEERDEWCNHLNKTLTLLRAWGSKNPQSISV
ncbi:anillin [Culicoides brevitarsis]|uniref:anillin n=1 Tax=Culicoides brevitarsis TaxID=469753 RepID=UPI00307C0E72